MGARIHVGTSGWVYAHWRRPFYEGVPPARWLEHYSRFFETVEINATFYRTSRMETVDRWARSVPPRFVFSAKGSQYITHNLKLRRSSQALERFFTPLEPFGRRLAVVLWQLPPQLKKPDPARLDDFLSLLPRHPRHAFEFRSPGWYTDSIAEVLERHGAAFCEHDWLSDRIPAVTGGFRYLRFHGSGARYGGRYGKRALRKFASSLRKTADEGLDGFVYFNNDLHGNALLDAFTMKDLLGQGRQEDRSIQSEILTAAEAPTP